MNVLDLLGRRKMSQRIGVVFGVARGTVRTGWILLHALQSSESGAPASVSGLAAVFDRSFDLAPIRVRYARNPRYVRVNVGDVDAAEAAVALLDPGWSEARELGAGSAKIARELKACGRWVTIEVKRPSPRFERG